MYPIHAPTEGFGSTSPNPYLPCARKLHYLCSTYSNELVLDLWTTPRNACPYLSGCYRTRVYYRSFFFLRE